MTPQEAITQIINDLNKLEQHWKELDAPDYVGQAYRDGYRSALRIVTKYWSKVVSEPRTVAEIRAEVERLKEHYNKDERVQVNGYEFCLGADCAYEQLLDFIDSKEAP